MNFEQQLNLWAMQGIIHDMTAIHFPNGKYPAFCNSLLGKVKYAELSDGCCLLIKGKMTNDEMRSIVLDSFTLCKVPMLWACLYFKDV
jgi:hypothetical protein